MLGKPVKLYQSLRRCDMSKPINPAMVRRLKTVADPSISLDASSLAYTLSWVDQERWESQSRIMLMDLGTTQAGLIGLKMPSTDVMSGCTA